MKIWTLFATFRQDVSALYDGMQQFLEVHEELARCASNPELVRHPRRHLKQTEQQVTNLDRIAEMLSEQDLPVTNHAARGIAREVRDAVDAAQTNPVRDWIIITAADTLLRAEITRYIALIAMARKLELPAPVVEMLQQNLGRDEQTLHDPAQLAPRVLQAAGEAARLAHGKGER
jgi:ferritin-like metal-binding protein YciE